MNAKKSNTGKRKRATSKKTPRKKPKTPRKKPKTPRKRPKPPNPAAALPFDPTGARIISVDVGVTNFSYAVLDETLILEKRRVCDFKGSKDYVEMTQTVLGWWEPHITEGTVLVLERQMKQGIMRLFQIALEVAWFHRTGTRARVVSPVTVKTFWGTSMGNYSKNKRAAVEKMDDLTAAGAPYAVFAGIWSSLRLYHDKMDDFADAALQALWARAVQT